MCIVQLSEWDADIHRHDEVGWDISMLPQRRQITINKKAGQASGFGNLYSSL